MMKRNLAVLLTSLLVCALAMPSAQAWQTTKKKKKTTSKITSPVLPAGTDLSVRIIENLDSGRAQAGDEFHGTLTDPIVVNGTTLYARGADVTGRVVSARDSGRLSRPGVLELELTLVKSGTKQSRLTTDPFKVEGKSHTKSNVTKIGGGAAAGAIIGAIAGGGKGAAIGAAVGAGAGTAAAAATGKQEAKVESEAVLTFVTSAPPAAAAASSTETASSTASEMPGESKPSDSKSGAVKTYDDDDPDAQSFSARDRRMIRNCFQDNASGLPPGLAKREKLPPGLQRQLEKNGTLPPGLQKRVQPLPAVCENELPRLPRNLERVVFSRRVMIINAASKILDLFDLDEE